MILTASGSAARRQAGRRKIQPKRPHEEGILPHHGCGPTANRYPAGLTLRIRRRRAQDVADTTDSLRAVACIRFVRPWLVVDLLCDGHG